MYAFVNGPLVWIAFAVFILGSIWQAATLYRMSKRTDKVFYNHYNPSAAASSVINWLIPFGSHSWREHPGFTLLTFAFHICLLAAPIFALGHATTLAFNLNVGWPSLPDSVVDALTVVFLLAALGILIRRFVVPQVRIVTEPKDIAVWVITVLPFLTGFMAYHKMLLPPDTMLLLHALTGCLMLICVPFTKLAHVFLFFMSRAFIGSEFARRGTKTW